MKAPYYIALVLGVLVCAFAVTYRVTSSGGVAEEETQVVASVPDDGGLKPAPPLPDPEAEPEPVVEPPTNGRRPLLVPVGAADETEPVNAGPLIPMRAEPGLAESAEPREEPEDDVEVSEPEPAGPPVLRITDPPTASDRPRTYIVEEGDTFTTIAQKVYGESRHWIHLARANGTLDPIKLQIGTEIILPRIDASSDAQPLTEAEQGIRSPEKVRQHTVKPGESLSSISMKYYQTATKWRTIFNANRKVIGSDPNAIRAGMTIIIPPVPVREQDE
ncbi:LysM peptidoglycan-binding domain-containing protein [Mucisphaera calidilacus]|uniref:LysM domain/BON superfamily protein n=1 Tax=Mucisphaera calidilacus TaxID=2527982 RepID=A0A518BZA5_9BACT|nr:LysM peptidoglycan-binding domain-containing protein [Mucisphaera calidilacus]QDU72301.1 LysM domain/BON superfamily protein [Mucisphaera calidilacus]